MMLVIMKDYLSLEQIKDANLFSLENNQLWFLSVNPAWVFSRRPMGEEAKNPEHVMVEGQMEQTGHECIPSKNYDKITKFQSDILKHFTVRNVKASI